MPHLAYRFEQDNPNRRGQVQAARPSHRDRQQIIGIRRQERFRQTLCLSAENQKIAGPERNVVVSALGFRREEKEARARFARPPQVFEGIPELDVDFLRVIEAGSLEGAIVDGESQGLDQVQSRTRGEAEPSDVAGIRRDLWLDEDDVEHGGSRAPPRDVYIPGFAGIHVIERWSARSTYNLLATNFSSFTMSAANFRMPSEVFSVAIALSLNRYRNFFSSISSRSRFAFFASSGSSLRSTGPSASLNFSSKSGLIVSRSQPASSRIWLTLRKLAPITSVL